MRCVAKEVSYGTIDMSTEVRCMTMRTASSSDAATLWYVCSSEISAQSVTSMPARSHLPLAGPTFPAAISRAHPAVL